MFTATPKKSHPILSGVERTGVYVGTDVVVLQGESLLAASNKDFLVVNAVGSGRVAAYGDSSAFSDGSFTGNKSGQRNSWTKLNNAQLAKNLIAWLAQDK